jgi:hypothetical protein
MTKEGLIKRALINLQKLPKEQVNIIAEYTESILKNYEEKILQEGIQKFTAESESFYFLMDEEDLYRVNDLKERYK